MCRLVDIVQYIIVYNSTLEYRVLTVHRLLVAFIPMQSQRREAPKAAIAE